MDEPKYSTLVAALHAVPDPRKARGKRFRWSVILSLIAAALVSGQKSGRAIGQWVKEHDIELIHRLAIARGQVPSSSTLERACKTLDVTALEAHLATYTQSLEVADETLTLLNGEILQAQAVDGKDLRGARDGKQTVKLVSIVSHGVGRVLAQQAVGRHQGEQTVAALLLAQQDLRATVTTCDAGLATRPLARQIREQGGHYFMVIKPNQRETHAAIAVLFDQPDAARWLPHERAANYRVDTTVDKQHGRLETRRLESSPYLNDYLDWPDLAQVMCRTCRRVTLKTGKISQEVTYALTSLPWSDTPPALLNRLWRQHWTIENRSHYVRDETFGEDRCRIRSHHAPQVLAALRNALICLLRAHGWLNLADAVRHYAASVRRALILIGAQTPGL